MRTVLVTIILMVATQIASAQCKTESDPFTGSSKKSAIIFIGPVSTEFSNSIIFEKVGDSLSVIYTMVLPKANRELVIDNVRVHFKMANGSITTIKPGPDSKLSLIEGIGVSQVIGVKSILTEELRSLLASTAIEQIRFNFSNDAHYDVGGLNDSKRKQVQKAASCIGT